MTHKQPEPRGNLAARRALAADVERLERDLTPDTMDEYLTKSDQLEAMYPRGGSPMARVKFLLDTVHPDHGEVKKGEVLVVDREYVRDYEELGIAHETDDDVTKRKEGPYQAPGGGKTRP